MQQAGLYPFETCQVSLKYVIPSQVRSLAEIHVEVYHQTAAGLLKVASRRHRITSDKKMVADPKSKLRLQHICYREVIPTARGNVIIEYYHTLWNGRYLTLQVCESPLSATVQAASLSKEDARGMAVAFKKVPVPGEEDVPSLV